MIPDDQFDVDEDGDVAENTPDLDLNTRVRAGTVDMGAYEFFCVGDTNDDGATNVLDLIDLLLCFGMPATPPCDTGQDINGDGAVNVLDLIDLILDYGCPSPNPEPFPASVQKCLDRYLPDAQKAAACIAALNLTNSP